MKFIILNQNHNTGDTMPIKNLNIEENYTVVSTEFCQDTRLTPQTKGMLIDLFSRPEDWDINIQGLMQMTHGIGRVKLYKSLKQAVKCGYMVRLPQSRNVKHHFAKTTWIACHVPFLAEELDDETVEKMFNNQISNEEFDKIYNLQITKKGNAENVEKMFISDDKLFKTIFTIDQKRIAGMNRNPDNSKTACKNRTQQSTILTKYNIENNKYVIGPDVSEPHAETNTKKPHAENKHADEISWNKEQKKFQNLTDCKIQLYKEAFPRINLERELSAMKLWLTNNPKRANKKDWNKFITNWLTKAYDKQQRYEAYAAQSDKGKVMSIRDIPSVDSEDLGW